MLVDTGLIDLMTPEDARDIVSNIVLPAFGIALRGLAEAGAYARRNDVPVLVHNAAASMKQVAELARSDVRLIAGHSNHSSFTVAEAVEHASRLRKTGRSWTAAGIAMASSHVADAIPGIAPNRGRIGPGAVADVVVADSRRLDDVQWVFVAGDPVVTNGVLAYR
ncbi:MAG: hypothetical protein ACRDUV_13135 [Pseudonocardiaceae bacterium]